MTLDVLLADNHLLAVVKPAGLPTVPDASGDESLLERARAWIAREYEKPGAVWLGVVHRLDRPVSGVVLFARTSKAAGRLAAAFRARRVEKLYWGLTAGRPPGDQGLLEQWLVKDAVANRVHVVPTPPGAAPGPNAGRLARTRWRVAARAGGLTLLELEPETGRPHQLRVAARTLGCPLLGDLKYGAREPLPDRSVALHARRLALDHPVRRESPERRRIVAPPPELGIWDLARRAADS